jgi:hypothetical protein
MPAARQPERTPLQGAWTTLDRVASALDRAAYRREQIPWREMTRMAEMVRAAREVYTAATPPATPSDIESQPNTYTRYNPGVT